MPDYIAYYRVSTQRQGLSGLGLEAQEAAVKAVAKGSILAAYTEVESGAKAARPELAKALAHCAKAGATLVVAKLDRLARNVAFISNLMEAKVDFIAADMPQANRLTIHILAAVAEHERDMISKRTRDALRAAIRRGVKLGKNGTQLAIVNKAKAMVFVRAMLPQVEGLIEKAESIRHLGRLLNEAGLTTPEGKTWKPEQARQLLRRVLEIKNGAKT